MRQLQVVGVSADGRLLLLATSADGRATHAIELDRRLERAVRGQPLDGSVGSADVMSPKEIQARLRSGASVEQVAREAGVPLGRVERYAGPVLSEREQVLNAARASTMSRPRGSRSTLPLGEAIAVNLRSLAYARPETAEWSAYRTDEGGWVVRYDVTIRGRRRRAEWAHHPAAREVTPLNSHATSLGLVELGRSRDVVAEKPDVVAPTEVPPRRAAAKKVVAKKVAAKKVAVTKPPAKQAAVTKTAVKTPVKKTAVKAVATKAPAKQVAGKKAPVKKAVAKSAAATRTAATTRTAARGKK